MDLRLVAASFSKITIFLGVLAALSACAPQETASFHTGDPEMEQKYGALKPSDLKAGTPAYVSTDRLVLRNEADEAEEHAVGTLSKNDKLEIVDSQILGLQQFVSVKVINSAEVESSDKTYFTSAKHLNPAPVGVRPAQLNAKQYFVISNIATEKVRVYRPCRAEENCKNKMVFEQDVVNGEDDDGTKTDLGTYRIASWDKFYETPGVYPAWYKASYPAPPAPGSSVSSWFKKDVMPNGVGQMRGAFGWYTAKVQPNPSNQWMHGTGGWGADKKKLIQFKDGLLGHITNLFHSIRSHGCTRIDNESIAYLRSLLPLDTTYIKIYALEGYRDASRKGYSQKNASWNYILTKVGGGRTNNHEVADRETVLSHKTPESEYIEQGTLSIDQFPDAVPFNPRRSRSKGGDLYKIGAESFRGRFLVDEGTLVNYHHPKGLRVGGYSDHLIPGKLISMEEGVAAQEE